MEVEMMEDDVFFAELSKRISLLITDDDEAADFGAARFPASAAAPIPVSLRCFFLYSSSAASSSYHIIHQACVCTRACELASSVSSFRLGALGSSCGFSRLLAAVGLVVAAPPRTWLPLHTTKPNQIA
ncbi:Os05g0397300 [Oryza sativa Japonica Group]|jgi:hypothetical protein|uniref:Os05g0397300 protein n=1 Tax=Oryza sativa subsp. japonica TaxID=39947 RepID=A0A0P0WLZ5_ORYSJ|nr:hypothetical protein EE612_029326 [Oryza sativa]BAS93890.1 Os05g0397300 [Oryza sativa Japonica Group]